MTRRDGDNCVPALLTSTANLGPAIIRMGAEVINGVEVHG